MTAYVVTLQPGPAMPEISNLSRAALDAFSGASLDSHKVARAFYDALQDFNKPASRFKELEATFTTLADEWRKQTVFTSSLDEITACQPYRDIIALGAEAIPFIFRELANSPDHWFVALREITGENPVLQEHRGNLRLMARDWLAWAESKGDKG